MSSSSTLTLTPQFLEAVNGVLLIIYLGILFIFSHYTISEMRVRGIVNGYRQRTAAISITMLLLGDFIIRACIWAVRHATNSYGWTSSKAEIVATVGATLGVLVCIVGGICILRHFAPKKWGAWPSIITIGVALLFGIGMAL